MTRSVYFVKLTGGDWLGPRGVAVSDWARAKAFNRASHAHTAMTVFNKKFWHERPYKVMGVDLNLSQGEEVLR